MTSNIDAFRTASVLICKYGDEANLVAAVRRTACSRQARDGSAVWQRVLTAVEETRWKEPQESEVVN